jgi:subfamily B ATP-binding cassette protein MsbA
MPPRTAIKRAALDLDETERAADRFEDISQRKIVWAEDMARLKRLLGYIKPYRWKMAAGLLSGALFAAINGGFPQAVKHVFHSLFESGTEPSFWSVFTLSLAIPAYFAIRGLIGYVNNYLIADVGTLVLRDLRTQVFGHVQRLSLDFFVRNKVASMTQRVSYSTANMQRLTIDLSDDLIKQPITIIIVIVILARTNMWFCLVGLILGIMCLVPMRYFGNKIRGAAKAEEESEGQLMGVVYESFSNIGVIKAYRMEEDQDRKFASAANRNRARAMRIRSYKDALSPLIEIIASLGIMVALLHAFFQRIPFSEFSAILAGFYIMYNPLKSLGKIHLNSQRVLTISHRVFDMLDSVPSVVDKPNALPLTKFSREIRFENIGHVYPDPRRKDKSPLVLSDINLVIPRGTICALVGRSGAGKTSLINLLLRFYDPVQGRILIDGQDTRDVTLASLRDMIGLVTQDTVLFADSVANNIGFGKPGATREQIMAAAKRAHADEFVTRMANGYDTMLSDRGQNLSAGQRQRIALARAFLKDPAILVLDEATSALDAESERLVQDAMEHLMQGRTVILIAHRLATVRNADQIVVLDEGRIIESGPHSELVKRDGIYRRFHDLQMLPA